MQIRIHPAFFLYTIGVGILSSAETVLCLLVSLFAHETGHCFVSRIAGETIERLEITPFGGVMTYAHTSVSRKGLVGLCVHAAGPLSNYLVILVMSSTFAQQKMDHSFIQTMITANASMMALNMLPVLPLDGGHVLFCIGYYLFPAAKLVSVLSVLGILAGSSLVLLAFYGYFAYKLLNCSLLFIGIYIAIAASECKNTLYAENMYSIIQERIGRSMQIRRVIIYHVDPGTRLLELIPILSKCDDEICFTFDSGEKARIFPEKTLCQALIASPDIEINQAYREFEKEILY